jgi:hypothetical protein
MPTRNLRGCSIQSEGKNAKRGQFLDMLRRQRKEEYVNDKINNHAIEPIMVETKAMELMKFYAENYETLVFRDLDPQAKKETLGEKPPVCRFCQRGRPEVSFANDAHVIPAFIGNKTLFSRYECNDCNSRFSEFEDDLAKMTMGDRAVGQVPKRKGFASLKTQGKKSSFERGPRGVIIKQYADEGIFKLDTDNAQMVVTYHTQSFRPLGVYKALAKMAFTLLPDEELPNFERLRIWLLETDVGTKKVYSDKGHWCFQTFVPGPSPFPKPIVALLKRKEAVTAPYMMFFLAFGNWTYQIFVPCPEVDADLADKAIDVMVYPHLYMLQPWLAKGPIQHSQLYLDEQKRRSENRTLRMHYDAIVDSESTPEQKN